MTSKEKKAIALKSCTGATVEEGVSSRRQQKEGNMWNERYIQNLHNVTQLKKDTTSSQ